MKNLTIISFCLILLSCNDKQDEIFCKDVCLVPFENFETLNFNDILFSQKTFSYNQNIIRDKNGKINYSPQEGKIENSLVDSTKYFHTAYVILFDKKSKSTFRFCRVNLIDNTLSFHFTDSILSNNTFSFDIVKTDSSNFTYLRQTCSLTDSSYKPPTYKAVWSDVFLKSWDLKTGDSVKGKFICKFVRIYDDGHHFIDTIKIYGLIKSVVE